MNENPDYAWIYPFSKNTYAVNDPPVSLIDTIIIHIHGGGFVSLDTNSHYNYLAKWSKGTGFPVFSIEYTNAPKKKFPSQLDECW